MRSMILASMVALPLLACTAQQAGTALNSAVPVAVTSDATVALHTFQDALGVAQEAVAANPGLSAKVASFQQQAAPYVADAQKVVAQAQTAPTLAALAAELLAETASYVRIVPQAS